MRFPVSVGPIPTLDLSPEEEQGFVTLTKGLLAHTVRDYEILKSERGGQVDTTQWKLTKKRQHLNIYQARTPRLNTSRSTSLLWYGTIGGNLNDIMYGLLTPTTERMKLKSSYVIDHIVDCGVLASIEAATPSNPFKGVHLKWCMRGSKSLLRQTMHYRDIVYAEATGVTRSLSGERIGYHILQTIEISGAHPLKTPKCERVNLSLFHLFRQKEENVVEIYVQAVMETPSALELCESIVSLSDAADLSEIKKLNWLAASMATKKKATRLSVWHFDRRICCVCQKALARKVDIGVSCLVCSGSMCKECRITKKLTHRSRTFCVQCVFTAVHTDGMIVASDELFVKKRRIDMCEDFDSITDPQGVCLELLI